ncbi:MAG TPA: alpha/beta fold hydrolase [Planctomycetota bacterium]
MRIACGLFVLLAQQLAAQDRTWPAPVEGDFVAKDFRFGTGETLPELRLHYRTIGTLVRDSRGRAQNAVLVLHGTTGSGASLLRPGFADELFRSGGALDAATHFLVLPDAIGHGRSSKPSDGLRARFPRYDYDDMVRAQHLLLTEHLKVDHLRLVIGTSMGGMHTWLWGIEHPDFADALLPLASLPVEIAGRNRWLRRMVIDSIRGDPAWRAGDYEQQPMQGLTGAIHAMLVMTSVPLQAQKDAPTREAADGKFDELVASYRQRLDANDTLYAFDASRTYDPSPRLAEIRAQLTAINFADDQVNPPELGLLEREVARVVDGRAVLVPISDATRGHGSHSLAALWVDHLRALLARSSRGASVGRVEPAQRIWGRKEQPPGSIWFRRVFELRHPVTTAEITVACDDHCTVFVNGVEVVAHHDWMRPVHVDVTRHLVSGDNVIAVAAKNDMSNAGLIFWLDWRAPGVDGTVVTDGAWRWTATEQQGFTLLRHDDRTWSEPANLGEVKRGQNVWGYPQ